MADIIAIIQDNAVTEQFSARETSGSLLGGGHLWLNRVFWRVGMWTALIVQQQIQCMMALVLRTPLFCGLDCTECEFARTWIQSNSHELSRQYRFSPPYFSP